MCNCQNCSNVHSVIAITDNTTSIDLTVSNSTDIGNLQPFILIRNKNVSVPTAPVPVTVNVNGASVELQNKYGIQIQSNRLPRRAVGAYVVPATGDPYVILFTTPYCRCNAI